MKRKIIQVGNSTQLISLPLKWAKSMSLKKGDEITIDEKQDTLIISIGNKKHQEKIEIEISYFDKKTIQMLLKSLYRKGYDEILTHSKTEEVIDFKTNKKVKIMQIVRESTENLIGYEIIGEGNHNIRIKDIAGDSDLDLSQIIRRVFLLTLEASGEFIEAIDTNNTEKFQNIIKSYFNITKFITYCLRLINKHGYKNEPLASHSIYTIISSIDLIIKKIKQSSEIAINFKKPSSRKLLDYCKNIDRTLHIYYEVFYKYNIKKVREISENKIKFTAEILNQLRNLSENDILIIKSFGEIQNLIIFLMRETIGFSLSHEKD